MSNSDHDNQKTGRIGADEKATVAIRVGPSKNERFEILRPLGQGGMGEVFLGIDRKNPGGRPLAIKTIFTAMMQEHEVAARFESEAKLLAAIKHPNVVELVEWGQIDQDGHPTHFMAMEYIDGISLHSLSRRRRLTLPDVLDISIQIAKGLQAIHAAQILHRDLKPGNVMITRDGNAKIIDFGIAKPASMGHATNDDPDRGFKTKTGIIIGTVNYIAPEVLRGEPASEASEVYALGLMIWEMLNGQAPFKAKNLAETMARVNGEMLTWSDAIFDIAPPGFTKLISRLTAKNPLKRIATAALALEELERIAADAKWTGRFGRRTRFDLDVDWTASTLARIKSLGVKDSDVGFVLQTIEDRLIELGDTRLSATEPIDIDDEFVMKCVNSYKSMRYRAAMTKATRVREQLGTGISIPSGKNLPIKKAIHPRIRSFASVVFSLLILALIATYLFRNAQSRIRGIASENERTVDGSIRLLDGISIESMPLITRGTSLLYSVRTQTPSGAELVTDTVRTLSAATPSEITWIVDDRQTIRTPRALFPLESYFEPFGKQSNERPVIRHLSEKVEFKIGSTVQVEMFDAATETNDDSRCTMMSSRPSTIFNQITEVWKIECLRRISKSDRLVQKSIEFYEYAPELAVILTAGFRKEDLDANGVVTSAVSKRMDLQADRSMLKPGGEIHPRPK